MGHVTCDMTTPLLGTVCRPLAGINCLLRLHMTFSKKALRNEADSVTTLQLQ